MANDSPVGVVLFQLGGPDTIAAIEPFLYNLFSDPDIIQFPFSKLARAPLARLIAASRAKKVAHHYRAIGGGSPIGELTRRQARALETELKKAIHAKVYVAMRYWHPLTAEVIQALARESFDELILLPLYPQYSHVTTGSSLNEWERQYRASGLNHARVKVIRQFYDHPAYLEAVVQQIEASLRKFPSPADVRILFSAHGVPESVIVSGDPYREQLEATLQLVMSRGGWSNPCQLCYQSRVGPGRWLRPSLEACLRELATQGARHSLVVPVSFVTDHVETLHEIDLEARELAAELGFAQFEMMPALNDAAKFIEALADLVRQAVGLGVSAEQDEVLGRARSGPPAEHDLRT